jgi:hypothetical protein
MCPWPGLAGDAMNELPDGWATNLANDIIHEHDMRAELRAAQASARAWQEKALALQGELTRLRGAVRDGDFCQCCSEHDCDCLAGVTWGVEEAET